MSVYGALGGGLCVVFRLNVCIIELLVNMCIWGGSANGMRWWDAEGDADWG